jgi:hypothetical protein
LGRLAAADRGDAPGSFGGGGVRVPRRSSVVSSSGGGVRMSCFVCFRSAQDGEAKKPAAADAKDARKDGPPDRGMARVGSDKSRSQGGSDSKKDIIIHRDGNSQNIAAQTFTFRELAAATKNFRQDCLLGEGGFGRVYKGRLENGQVSLS